MGVTWVDGARSAPFCGEFYRDCARQTRIRTHLDDCAPCLRQFGLEQDVRSLVARCCGGDVAPDSLKTRIRGRLTEVVIETSHLEYRAD